jgi:hypothetical protein
MDDMKEFEDDPDWLRSKAEAERKDPNYWPKRNIEEIETQLRYSLPIFKFIGWAIVVLLALILYRLW